MTFRKVRLSHDGGIYLKSEVWFAGYCRYGTDIGADKESLEIVSELKSLDLRVRVFGISCEKVLEDSNVEVLTFGRVRCSVLDRFSRFLRNGSRFANESSVDRLICRRLSEPTTLISSCLVPMAFEKNASMGGKNIFYAKNGYDFYDVLIGEASRWNLEPKRGEALYLKQYGRSVTHASKICFLSSEDPQLLVDKYGYKGLMARVRMGVDASDFDAVFQQNRSVRTRRQLQQRVWGCMGGSLLRKGTLYAIESWLRAKMSENDKLLIVGVGREDQTLLKRRYGDLASKNIVIKEYMDKYDFFSQLTYFLSPSTAEGQARAALESLAAGVPLISTHRGSAEIPVEHFVLISGDISEALLEIYKSPPVFKPEALDRARDYVASARAFSGLGSQIAQEAASLHKAAWGTE